MKRLLSQIGLIYLSVLAVVFYLSRKVTFILLLVFFAFLVAFLVVRKCRKTVFLPIMAATAIIACVVNIGYTTLVYDKTVEKYSGQTAVVKAQLKGEPINYYGSYCYNFKALKVDDTECNFKFYGYNADLLNIEPYDIVTFEAQLSQSDSSSKISKGYFISALMDVETLKVNQDESEKKPVLYYASVLREKIRENFTMLLDAETTQLCSAIFIGDKYALSETINQDFMRAGVTHLVVVSGLHFSIIVWMLFKLAEKYGKLRKVVGAFSILLILSYMFLVGFSPSVVRSAIMLIIYSVGMMISAQPYSYNSLAFAGLCIVLPDPFSAGDVSLILSFATTFSIITFTPKIYYYFSNTIINRIAPAKKKKEKSLKYSLYSAYRGFLKAAFQLLSANIGAVIASIPLSIMFFDSISTVSVLATFIISPIISVVLILSIVICLLSFVPYTSFILAPIIFVTQICSHIIICVVKLLSDLELSHLNVTYNFVYMWLFMSVLFFIAMLLSEFEHRVSVFIYSTAFLLIVGYLSALYISDDYVYLRFYDVGDGTAVMYSCDEHDAVISIDCDTKHRNSLIKKIESDTNSVEYCSSVANNLDSYRSVLALCDSFAINDVLMYDTERSIAFDPEITRFINVTESCSFDIGESARVVYFSVGEKYITYMDSIVQSVLIIPDSVDAEQIPEVFRNADIIVLESNPMNFELLSCETLIVSASEDKCYNIMDICHVIAERVFLTSRSDIEFVLEV